MSLTAADADLYPEMLGEYLSTLDAKVAHTLWWIEAAPIFEKIAADAAKSEQHRLVDLALAAVTNDETIFWLDRVRISGMIRDALRPGERGRKPERPSERAERWFRNPANRAAFVADWIERAWRKRNRVKNNRVEVNGELISVHMAAAQKAVRKCERMFARNKMRFPAIDPAVVAELLRKGRTSPN